MSDEPGGGASGLLPSVAPGARIAGYRLEQQVGAGGMAVVYRARDERLHRLVALKVLAPGLAADDEFRHRFIRESRATAAVDDPHIIPVFEAGEADGVLFIAMRYVPGGDVRSLLRRQGPLSPGRTAAIISPVASALDAGHAAGLVHRDVKPANMLLDKRAGRPDHVYLSDFGLSKGALSTLGLTGSRQFLGTPDYTAPEQIEGLSVDGRTDQYALACAAFELLIGAPPFRRDEVMAVIWAQVSEPPPRLTSRRPDLPQAADDVLARALAKAPADRYPSCREFADALRGAFGLAPYDTDLDAVPQVAHPRAEVAGEASEPGAVAVEAGAATSESDAATDAADTAPRQPTTVPRRASEPDRPDRQASQPSMEADLPDPKVPLSPPRQRGWKQAAIAAGSIAAVAGIVTAALVATSAGRSPRKALAIPGTGDRSVQTVAFSPDGRSLAVGDRNNKTYLWNAATGHQIAIFANPGAESNGVYGVAFSPDGRTLAAASANGSTYLWDVSTGQRVGAFADPRSRGVDGVAFSRDGKTLATGDANGFIYLWNVASGRGIATLTGPGFVAGVTSVAFSPDGSTLAAGDLDASIYLWDVATATLTATIAEPGGTGAGSVTSVAFSKDGKMLATGDAGGFTYLWDAATSRQTLAISQPSSNIGGVNAVVFGRDGKTLATGDDDGSTYLFDLATGKLIATFTDPGAGQYGVMAVAFSPNGKTLAVGDSNGTAYLWNVG